MAKDAAYYEAEKKIQEALESGAKELDLCEMGLTELPPELWKLKNLKVLNLGNEYKGKKNKLTEVPKEIGQLTQLKKLYLNHNQLTILPESLGRLIQLTELSLYDNQLTILPESLGQLTRLKNLYLSRNQLAILPESLGQLTLLKKLNLGNNKLTTLPESLGQLTQLIELNLEGNELTTLPESLGQLTQLIELNLESNELATLPESLRQLTQLKRLDLSRNRLTLLPEWIGLLVDIDELLIHSNKLLSLPNTVRYLKKLQILHLGWDEGNKFNELPFYINEFQDLRQLIAAKCGLRALPESIGQLKNLFNLWIGGNHISNLPISLLQLKKLNNLNLDNNPLNLELTEAYKQGIQGVKAYLRAKNEGQIILNQAKLILVGEGEVGKTCLMDALLGKPFKKHKSTHGIEIQQIKVKEKKSKKEFILNGWDFGGQRVYRPTHQLFFSAPAVYLVIWKPREGPQQGFVKEWIQLIKRREPSAKILVVATHGGPQQRQPDIDRQELWDLFGKESVINFYFVDSKPDKNGKRKGIEELKQAIAKIASELPEVGRSVPKSFDDVRKVLQEKNLPYLPFNEVLAICHAKKMDDEIADLFIRVSHRLGHLTHYENDPILSDIVILRPDWLSTAMSYILDDEETRNNQGLVKFSRLAQLWNDPLRPKDTRYPKDLHEIFLRLMERFDLSYRVAGLSKGEEKNPISLIAQLVPDNIPEEPKMKKAWGTEITQGDIEQTQICRIVDAQNGQSANAEGLFYQLIVRLHRFSLGRIHWDDSIHWQRGLILDDEYNGRALLRHIGNDVHITVRAAFPERFLAMLTGEVKYLVESFWEGLRCDVMVPCINPCGKDEPGTGMFEVEKLITFKKQGMNMFPCMVSGCNKAQDIGFLLRNAPVATAVIAESLFVEFDKLKHGLAVIYHKLQTGQEESINRFDKLDINDQRLLSRIDDSFDSLMRALTDEAKEGPRLFSLIPIVGDSFDPRNWVTARFRLTLWCEHSHIPLPVLNDNKKIGVYEFDVTRDWVKESAPLLKALTITLRSLLPVAFSAAKLITDVAIYKEIENQLDFSKECIDALIDGSEGIGQLFLEDTINQNPEELQRSRSNKAQGAKLREFHALLQKIDPNGSYGNLVRVMNKRQEFLWVHEKFASEY